MARIIVKERGWETRSFSVTDGKMSVGRSSENSIVLSNRYASTRHCEISCEKGECALSDLGSTNGVFVNGVRVTGKRLDDGDRILVGGALLIYIANEEAVELDSLVAQLQEGSPNERELAANLLGQLGTPAVAEPLFTALKEDPESKVKAAAAEALGLLGGSKAVKTLLTYFDTTDALLRNSVVRAIIRLADDKTVDGVAGFLKHEDRRVRVLVAHTLGQTHNPRATKHLTKALGDEAFAVREAAVKALGDLEDQKALDALTEAAKDPHRFPQVWVIESLGKLRSPKAVPVVVKALKGPDPEAREAAADALGRLRAKEAAPALIDTLGDADPTVRRAAANSLEKLRRHIEVERQLSGSSTKDMKTMEISLIGEHDEHKSAGAPLFGEDRSRWRQWWREQSAK